MSSRGIHMGASSIQFLTWNVQGISGPVKMSYVFAQFKHLGPEIVFLQETNLMPKLFFPAP